jgi:hypothetical protein
MTRYPQLTTARLATANTTALTCTENDGIPELTDLIGQASDASPAPERDAG